MNTNETNAEAMSPAEHADLVRDARQLVTAVERAVRRTGAVFVIASGGAVAATALELPVVGEVAAVVAVIAFACTLIVLMARIALGPMPAEVAHTAPAEAPAGAANGSARPATGSGPATARNGVISTK